MVCFIPRIYTWLWQWVLSVQMGMKHIRVVKYASYLCYKHEMQMKQTRLWSQSMLHTYDNENEYTWAYMQMKQTRVMKPEYASYLWQWEWVWVWSKPGLRSHLLPIKRDHVVGASRHVSFSNSLVIFLLKTLRKVVTLGIPKWDLSIHWYIIDSLKKGESAVFIFNLSFFEENNPLPLQSPEYKLGLLIWSILQGI